VPVGHEIRLLRQRPQGGVIPLGPQADDLQVRAVDPRPATAPAPSADGYELTRLGTALGHALRPLDEWAVTWAQAQNDQNPVEA
jgi:hypothetical protein